MSSLRKIGLAIALVAAGPFIWSMAWAIVFPTFLLVYYEYYGEWTGTIFQNYLVVGTAGIYIIAGLLTSRFGQNTSTADVNQAHASIKHSEPEPKSEERPSRPDPPPPAPNPQSSPQLTEIMDGLRNIGKRMDGIEANQKKISPFLKLGTPTQEGENKT